MKPTNSRIMTQQEKLKKDILNEVLNCIAQKEPDAEKCTDYIIGIISDVLKLVEKLTAWVKVEENTPICFETGNWDGKRSDIVLVKTREGETLTARLYNGILDGSEFNDWAEARHDYTIEVTEWKPII